MSGALILDKVRGVIREGVAVVSSGYNVKYCKCVHYELIISVLILLFFTIKHHFINLFAGNGRRPNAISTITTLCSLVFTQETNAFLKEETLPTEESRIDTTHKDIENIYANASILLIRPEHL